jgi:hypothetical protein
MALPSQRTTNEYMSNPKQSWLEFESLVSVRTTTQQKRYDGNVGLHH